MPHTIAHVLVVNCSCLATCRRAGCEYGGTLRPSVLSELDPPVVRLVNEFPELDTQNKAIVGELFGLGGLPHVEEEPNGVER
jgi:hypothetical protein